MNLISSSGYISRTMAYLMVCTLIVAFGALGSVIAGTIGDAYSFVGLFLGSALGAFIAVYESTILGCIIGMLIGLLISPLIGYMIDYETAFLAIFISSLIGAILGEPICSFWQEADYDNDDDYNQTNKLDELKDN